MEYQLKALNIFEEFNNKLGIAKCYTNIGNIYANQSNYPETMKYYSKSLQAFKEIDNKNGMAGCYGNLSGLHTELADYKKGIAYSDSTLQLSKQIGDIEEQRWAYANLAEAYNKTGKYKEAYEAHVKFKQLTDSIFNTENSKQLGDMKTKFEVEKKETELKIKSEAEKEKLKAIADEEKKRQGVIIYSVAGVLLIVIIFSLFLFNRFRITRRQKKVIEEQKVLVDKAYETLHEKNKEVMDSIHYAKRIQTALITSEKYIENALKRLTKNN